MTATVTVNRPTTTLTIQVTDMDASNPWSFPASVEDAIALRNCLADAIEAHHLEPIPEAASLPGNPVGGLAWMAEWAAKMGKPMTFAEGPNPTPYVGVTDATAEETTTQQAVDGQSSRPGWDFDTVAFSRKLEAAMNGAPTTPAVHEAKFKEGDWVRLTENVYSHDGYLRSGTEGQVDYYGSRTNEVGTTEHGPLVCVSFEGRPDSIALFDTRLELVV